MFALAHRFPLCDHPRGEVAFMSSIVIAREVCATPRVPPLGAAGRPA